MNWKPLSWLLLVLAATWLSLPLTSYKTKGPDLIGFGALPVLHEGRIKPLDTVARATLLMIQGRQTLAAEGHRISALEWMLETMANPQKADLRKIFRIDDPDVLGLMGKEPKDGKYFSFKTLSPRLAAISEQAAHAEHIEVPSRSRFHRAILNLGHRLMVYQRLKNSFQPADSRNFSGELKAYQKILGPGREAFHKAHSGAKDFDQEALAALGRFFSQFEFLSQAAYFRSIPPTQGQEIEKWQNVGDALLESARTGEIPPAVFSYAEMLRAYEDSDGRSFNAVLAAYRNRLKSSQPQAAKRAGYEFLFNRTQPFYKGMLLYLAALLLVCASWLLWPVPLGRSSSVLLLLGFAVHTLGLLSRMFLEGRPPVTNLYSSAVFVGWTAVLLGIVVERMTRRGFAIAMSGAVGFATLIVAHHLTGSGDTMEVMRAVLDSNFWLATHVITITIGYSGMFLAGALAHVYILGGLWTRAINGDTGRTLPRSIYGVLCFSLFFSFLGTVLGGIWADQSWGRFWGWDPKENGALLIVLWSAFILHARWGGYIRERGLAVMAVFGNVITALSWFGVNMLGIGLHSYGFMDKTLIALSAFVASQLMVIALGIWSVPMWRTLFHRMEVQ
ncbi:MAG: cytochrome c biogenesis protein CcsA [Elusimicrobia bacterium]|nr:cytochrome c biogenesis protein CcsA [Elusimicrobiota bacterium]